MQSQFFAKHAEHEHRNGQNRAKGKTVAHRNVLGIGSFFGGDVHRLEGHSALWTRAGTGLNNFGIHWARVTNSLLLWGRHGRRGGGAFRRLLLRGGWGGGGGGG